ncbi:hypothetical protein [Paenibacillus sp. CAA11]|uniref:hypothetical protein n=1 Tax=Paenibacillus sp. CAA11 TaxID=1532905 RepID=UPI00131F229D|nr:hypothetical protein [Paenibacillus sp. CAA11]
MALGFSGCHAVTMQGDKQQDVLKDGALRAGFSLPESTAGQGGSLRGDMEISTPMLQSLWNACAKQKLKLTNEMIAQDLDGNLSVRYYIAGDPNHYIILYEYQTAQERKEQLRKAYSAKAALISDQTITRLERGNSAIVYVSSGSKRDKYTGQISAVFAQISKEPAL